ncbi:MAG TPA: hypothetical protein VGS41_01200, partial [Chthonomonadales bacterium]|nr:hypothetical protein [Chthonomonadales bacterium]
LSNRFYLVYRQRQPRELGRGMECRIAQSDNGIAFRDIWALPKASLGALSVERGSLVRGFDGLWRLYIGYVDPADRRWRIGFLEAEEPDGFDIGALTPILTAEVVGSEGVKDPNVFILGRMLYMIASYATRNPELPPESERRKHESGDVYSTGLTRSRTGAAISGDGRRFQWIGDISPIADYPRGLAPAAEGEPAQAEPWDAYCRRIVGLAPLESGGFLAFYDGGRSVEDNYEERTGLATTFDLRTYFSLTPDAPALCSPHGSGSLRYVDALPVGHELFYYYEIARPDGAHELRVSVVECP